MYSTYGSVRGSCGHTHLTLAEADECLRADVADCASLPGGAYSDRRVVRADGLPLSPVEVEALDALRDAEDES